MFSKIWDVTLGRREPQPLLSPPLPPSTSPPLELAVERLAWLVEKVAARPIALLMATHAWICEGNGGLQPWLAMEKAGVALGWVVVGFVASKEARYAIPTSPTVETGSALAGWWCAGHGQ